MPYIKQQARKDLDPFIQQLLMSLYSQLNIVDDDGKISESHITIDPGELNYTITKLIWSLFELDKNYANANMLVGVLELVKQEFYRIKVSAYEDTKVLENGSVEDGRRRTRNI